MKPKSLLLLGVASVCGLIAAVATARHLAGNRLPTPQEPAEARKAVVVATQEIPAGTQLKEEMLKVVELPTKDLPEGTFTATAELTGQILRFPVFKGEPVLSGKLGKGLQSLADELTPGMLACTVKVGEEDRPMTGLINPKDHVDVHWLQMQPDFSSTSVWLLLQNVKVLAVGQRTGSDEVDGLGAKDGRSNLTDNYTLEVTPRQYQRVQAALSKGGKIRLALRRKGDTIVDEIDEHALDRRLGLIAPPTDTTSVGELEPEPEPASPKWEVEYVKGNEFITESLNVTEPFQPSSRK